MNFRNEAGLTLIEAAFISVLAIAVFAFLLVISISNKEADEDIAALSALETFQIIPAQNTMRSVSGVPSYAGDEIVRAIAEVSCFEAFSAGCDTTVRFLAGVLRIDPDSAAASAPPVCAVDALVLGGDQSYMYPDGGASTTPLSGDGGAERDNIHLVGACLNTGDCYSQSGGSDDPTNLFNYYEYGNLFDQGNGVSVDEFRLVSRRSQEIACEQGYIEPVFVNFLCYVAPDPEDSDQLRPFDYPTLRCAVTPVTIRAAGPIGYPY